MILNVALKWDDSLTRNIFKTSCLSWGCCHAVHLPIEKSRGVIEGVCSVHGPRSNCCLYSVSSSSPLDSISGLVVLTLNTDMRPSPKHKRHWWQQEVSGGEAICSEDGREMMALVFIYIVAIRDAKDYLESFWNYIDIKKFNCSIKECLCSQNYYL